MMKEAAYVKFIINSLNSFGFDAKQLQTSRSHSGHYIKKEPVDLYIGMSNSFWRIEVKRSHKDDGQSFYWKELKNNQLLALKELLNKNINSGILICWNLKEYTFIDTKEISEHFCTKLEKSNCKIITIEDLFEIFKN
jgi:penicillin-binding protein-related factor A (putative recombinase)